MAGQNENSFFVADSIPGSSDRFTRPEPIRSGQGGFSMLYRASRHGRVFALKALKPEWRDSDIHKTLLRKEYDTIMGLNHPNLVTAYSYETIDDIGECIVEEWIDGMTFDQFISAHRADRDDVLRLLLIICDALGYIHSLQIIHRDLKPANIMVTTTGGTIKLIDFGIADGPSLDMVKGAGGTHGFAAPEQYQPEMKKDHRADIYAFGKILESLNLYPATAKRCTASRPEMRPATATEVAKMLRKEHRRPYTLLRNIGIMASIAIIGSIAVAVYHNAVDSEPTEPTRPASTLHPGAPEDSIPGQSEPLMTASIGNSRQEVSATAGQTALTTDTIHIITTETIHQQTAEPSQRPYIDRLREAATACASRHFKAHIASADTVASSTWLRRYNIRYWRHLAKEEMKRWIAANPDSDLNAEMAAAFCSDLIMDYSNSHEREHEAGWGKIESRLPRNVAIFSEYIADELPDGSLEVYTIGEDDEWHRSIRPPRKRPH